MRKWLSKTFDSLRASYWFVPSLMTFGALVLALVMVQG